MPNDPFLASQLVSFRVSVFSRWFYKSYTYTYTYIRTYIHSDSNMVAYEKKKSTITVTTTKITTTYSFRKNTFPLLYPPLSFSPTTFPTTSNPSSPFSPFFHLLLTLFFTERHCIVSEISHVPRVTIASIFHRYIGNASQYLPISIKNANDRSKVFKRYQAGFSFVFRRRET